MLASFASYYISCRWLFFLSHRSLKQLHTSLDSYLHMQLYSLRYLFCSPTKKFSSSINFDHKSSMLVFRGSQKLHILEFVPLLHKNFNTFYRCLFCQQKSKKGEIVRAKCCPRVFWILLDKTVEELTMFSSINSWIGSWRSSLVIKLQGRSSSIEA